MGKVRSEITSHEYDDDKVVYYKNAKQSCFYVNNGATLLDVLPTDDNYFIFVFSRSDHKRLIEKWNKTKPSTEAAV